jgi:hypothetical protein
MPVRERADELELGVGAVEDRPVMVEVDPAEGLTGGGVGLLVMMLIAAGQPEHEDLPDRPVGALAQQLQA